MRWIKRDVLELIEELIKAVFTNRMVLETVSSPDHRSSSIDPGDRDIRVHKVNLKT